MTLTWRSAIPTLCLVAALSTYAGWHAWRVKGEARKAAADAQMYRAKAERGDAWGEARLGSAYALGLGIPRDDAKALVWYRKSADQGFPGGEAGIGYCFYYGIAVPQNAAMAVHWFQLAAKQGNASAEDALGRAYFGGKGVSQDDAESVRWFRKAADQDYPPAEYDLGWMLDYGRGVARDRAGAVRLLRRSAAQGYPHALRVVTLGLTPATGAIYLLVLLWDLWSLSEFCYAIPELKQETLHKRRSAVLFASSEALSALLTGVTWYGYTHHRILRLGYGMNAFTACKWVLVPLVIGTVFHAVHSSRGATDSVSPDQPPPLEIETRDEPEAIHPS